MNDADAAGVAEMEFGAGKGRRGLVIMVTLGTGIGSALFIDGVLVPNTELGHLKMGKHDAEHLAAESVRETKDLSWKDWAKRVDEYLLMVEALFSPDLFIIGGGVSKKADKFLPHLATCAPRSWPRSCSTRPASSAPRSRTSSAPASPTPTDWRFGAPTSVIVTRVGAPNVESGGWVGDGGAAGEAGVGPVPPVDGVLAVEPAQQVGLARRRERGKSISPRSGSRTMIPSALSSSTIDAISVSRRAPCPLAVGRARDQLTQPLHLLAHLGQRGGGFVEGPVTHESTIGVRRGRHYALAR